MDPNQLMQIIQMLQQQGGGGGMGMGGMMGQGMPQMALPQMQAMGPKPVIPSPGLAFNPGSHQTSYGDVANWATRPGPQQPATQTGTPAQSVQGPDPNTLAPGVQAGVTQMQSAPPLQAAQGPGVDPILQGAQGVQPDQSRLGPSGGGGLMGTLGTMGTNLYQNFLAQYGLGPRAQTTKPTNPVIPPPQMAYDPGKHDFSVAKIIMAAIAAA